MGDLLAKSGEGAPTLAKHTQDVIDAAAALFGTVERPTRLGDRWLAFFKARREDWPIFVRTLCAAAALHDFGKANDGFQKAVQRQGNQAIRHEHLSGLLMFHPPIWNWLRTQTDIDWDVALCAVLSHHLKLTDVSLAGQLTAGSNWVVRMPRANDIQFREILQLIRKADWPTIPDSWSFDRTQGCESIPNAKKQLVDHLERLDEDLGAQPERARLLRAVRAALIAADAAGSGLVRQGHSLRQWIEDRFDANALCNADYIRAEIIDRRIAELSDKWKGWHTFQIGAGEQGSRTLMLAPCGAGKTLAAWKWIEKQATIPVKRVVFLYPTRATATEGFRDYVSWAPEGSLVHGTASYELDGMFENPADERSKTDYTAEARLFAIGFWDKRVFSATVDQFLGFLQYAYGAVCLLPVLADSVIVIDEVHSFDDAMFSALKKFLAEFDVPALCMTATLPRQRRHQLESQCRLTVYDEKPEDLLKIAGAPRYRVHRLKNKDDALVIARQGLLDRKKILWVVNTVARAQQLAKDMRRVASVVGGEVLCYHSRFTLDHRKAWHGKVVQAFKAVSAAAPKAIIAITTQVCEMSLDLDADILITEDAPITALIQRMGRCNRKTDLPLPGLGDVYVYKPGDNPEDGRPYSPEELRNVDVFVSELVSLGAVKQTDLETALAKHGKTAPVADRFVSFTGSGPYADGDVEDFRDLDERTTPGVLDLDEYVNTAKLRRPGLIVPVPRKLRAPRCNHREAKHLVLAPSANYDPVLGLCDQPIARTGV